MKFIQIFIPVAILHLVVIAVILLQPGCQARQTPPPPPGADPVPGTATATTTPDYVEPTTMSTGVSPVKREAPMRPVGEQAVSSDLPSSFNGNLDLGGEGGLLVPEPLGGEPLAYNDGGATLDAPEMTPYSVVPGDTLSGIARRHGVTVADLREANALTSDTIRVGDTLMIPSASLSGGSGGLAPVASGRESRGDVYEVVPGDNLTVIARRHGLSVPELKALNDLTSDRIVIGQKLYVPQSNSSYTPPPASRRTEPVATNDGTTYVVKAGDTPIVIARRLGVSHQELMRVNGISDPTKMRVGQVLIVPGARPSTTNSIVPPVSRPAPPPPSTSSTAPMRVQPTRPAVIDNSGTTNPDDLEAQLDDDLPVSPVEVVEPTGNGG